RAGMVPVITVSGLAFASLLSGTVLVEQVFGWPGVGQYAYRAASGLDLPASMGVSLFVAGVYTSVKLAGGPRSGFSDPRIRGSGASSPPVRPNPRSRRAAASAKPWGGAAGRSACG